MARRARSQTATKAKSEPAETGTALATVPEIQPWRIKGELALNCSCDLFCPCVISLGQHPPTHGYCHAWIAVRIDRGSMGGVTLDGLNVAMMVDIPGKMGSGNWSMAHYIDENADNAQYAALMQIFTGRAKGTTGLFRLLVGTYIGSKKVPVVYETHGDVRTIIAGETIKGQIEPIPGAIPGKGVTIENTSYWMGAFVTVAKGLKSRVRDFGRVWNFDDRSAEICAIDWSGP
ncbi:MAG: DUF1326 domain-containing protein [Pseudomonadota bacterium]